MGIVIKSLIGSFCLHVSYIGLVFSIAFAKTLFYKPEFPPNAVVLQSEVAFGFTGSPFSIVVSFVVVAGVLGVVFLIRRKQTAV